MAGYFAGRQARLRIHRDVLSAELMNRGGAGAECRWSELTIAIDHGN